MSFHTNASHFYAIRGLLHSPDYRIRYADNLDILWLKDDSLEGSLEDSDNLPPPAELAAEIVESLEAALEEFRAVEEALASSAE